MKFSFVELSCRIQLFCSFYSYLFLRQIVVETNTRIMRSKISDNFVTCRCITNENPLIIFQQNLKYKSPRIFIFTRAYVPKSILHLV
jgi:hypothetical protein